jgi:hypothetical protein
MRASSAASATPSNHCPKNASTPAGRGQSDDFTITESTKQTLRMNLLLHRRGLLVQSKTLVLFPGSKSHCERKNRKRTRRRHTLKIMLPCSFMVMPSSGPPMFSIYIYEATLTDVIHVMSHTRWDSSVYPLTLFCMARSSTQLSM